MRNEDDPGKSRDPGKIRAYLESVTGNPDDVTDTIVNNWTRSEQQTLEEIEEGRKWEEKNRLEASPVGKESEKN